MELKNKVTIVTLLVFLTSFNVFADSKVAQCLHTGGVLNVSAVVKTTRGTEFFEWIFEDFQLDKIIGSHTGNALKNLTDNVTLKQNFSSVFSTSSVEGEVSIDITNTDLNPLSLVTAFTFQCKIIAY